jgi:hypothetical protein
VVGNRLALLATIDDVDCPVEKAFIGQDVAAMRVETVSDLADTPGSWERVGELELDRPSLIVVDPGWTPTGNARRLLAHPPTEDTDLRTDGAIVIGCVLPMPVGRYVVATYKIADGYDLGVRLVHVLGHGNR